MTPTDPWSFGLNHLLTLIGFVITISIATAGFRTFGKWKREKIEERRIDIALDALSIAYEADLIFQSIRSPLSVEPEWADMKGVDDPQRRRQAGPFFATLQRLHHHRGYFERALNAKPRFMAVFGRDAGEIFMTLLQARRNVEVAAEMLLRDAVQGMRDGNDEFQQKLRNDVWDMKVEGNEITTKVREFVRGVEKHCLPVVTLRLKTGKLK